MMKTTKITNIIMTKAMMLVKSFRLQHIPQNFRCLIVSSIVCTASQRTLLIREKSNRLRKQILFKNFCNMVEANTECTHTHTHKNIKAGTP